MQGATRHKGLTTAATWAWLGVFLFQSIPVGDREVVLGTRAIEAALIGVCALVALARGVRANAVNRVAAIVFGMTVVSAAYIVLAEPIGWGTTREYALAAVGFVVTNTVTVLFAAWFFDRDRFVDVFTKMATIALGVALAGFVLWRLFDITDFVNRGEQGAAAGRLQGTLSEPSAWAPVLAALVLLAYRRRAWWLLAAAGVAVVLTKSPTVILVLCATAVLYLLLSHWNRDTTPMVVVVVVLALMATIWFVESADADAWRQSGNPVSQTVGRLLSGIENVRSGGDVGRNERYTSTSVTFDEVDQLDIGLLGAGPDAHVVYFVNKYSADLTAARGARPNAIWVMAAFNHGYVGMVLLLGLLAVTVARMRRDLTLAAILLPFVVASLVNSAAGIGYRFAVLAMLLFAFRWERRNARALTAVSARAFVHSLNAPGL